ncbi:hypothetical protein E6C27_scaffold43059G001310 [Cucumis melo var. makuwa]|uniref:Uncharacterized protein n=1 Tax=Cucumis melo var. makuwa TaxID=1194695 RepID=A0A5A7SXD7_CUCMM|nr:hypothetical protein E6C27_scaffold43059G001310 [Cucumis melo var. makuwa]
MATKKEENQCPTSTYARTLAFKRLSISTSKKHRPSTSAFDRLKMTNDQQQREMKTLKPKPFHEENDDDKIHSRVPSRMKRKLSVDINTEEDDKGAALPWLLQEDVDGTILPTPLQTTKVPDRSYWGMDLTVKARSSPDRSWIVDSSITSPNDDGARSLLPGDGYDDKSPIIPL